MKTIYKVTSSWKSVSETTPEGQDVGCVTDEVTLDEHKESESIEDLLKSLEDMYSPLNKNKAFIFDREGSKIRVIIQTLEDEDCTELTEQEASDFSEKRKEFEHVFDCDYNFIIEKFIVDVEFTDEELINIEQY